MELQTTHETTVRGWFTPETMPPSWKAAEPTACNELAQLLQDKVLKAYNIGLLDGAARRTDAADNAIFEADSSIGTCLCCLMEAAYVIQKIHQEFTPIWSGDGMDSRHGANFIHEMCIASGIVEERSNKALEALEQAQAALGLDGSQSTSNGVYSVA